eukprot:1567859-Prorocentrum_lima.AAC.1
MTSSLVGSEMCIRDSNLPAWASTRGTRPGEATQPRREPQSVMRPQSAPVSYTHLTLPTICSV